MIVCGVPLDGATTQELKMIQAEIGKEIKNRENAAKKGEWNTVRQAIKNWCDKYGPITAESEDREEFTICSNSFGPIAGDILLF